jgi:hypothetical protein
MKPQICQDPREICSGGKFTNRSLDSKQPYQAASMSGCLAVCQSCYLAAAVLHAVKRVSDESSCSSGAMEVACEIVIAESPTPSMVVGLQSAIAVSSACTGHHHWVIDSPYGGRVAPVAMVLQATGIGESAPMEFLIPDVNDMAKKNRSLLSSSLVMGVACEDLPARRFGVVDDNKPNILVTSCNASSAGGEECGEAWA